jgi:hypothetical protein
MKPDALARVPSTPPTSTLAEELDAPIVTCDTPLAKGPSHRAHIEVIE